MARKLFSLAAIALLVLAFFNFSLSKAQQDGETILYTQDFEFGQAPDWNLDSGWEVVSQNGGHVLQGIGHVWARLQLGPWTDYFIRFRLRLNKANSALHANIRVDGAARYFIGFNMGGIYLSRQEADQSFHENLAQAGPPGSGWHNVEISANGGQITVSLDGKQRISYVDPDPLLEGGIAFESLAQQSVWIDDVVVGEKTPTETESTPSETAASPGGPAQAAPTMKASELKWLYLGGPLGGLGYDVRMRPDNPDVMYVTDARAGVFRSRDGGITWQPINNGITTRTGETGEIIPVFCLTIDPHNPDIIWAGTQSLTGLFKSVDGGDTWKKMDQGLQEASLTLRGITVDPRSSDIVYVAGEVSSWEWAGKVITGHEFDLTKGVVYKSTDGGRAWNRVWSGDNLARYIWIDPRNPEVVYVSTGIFDREAANSDYATGQAGGVGILKSMDGGKTWQPANNGLVNLYVGSLFMHPQNPDILLAGVGSVTYHEGSGVYLSTDGGMSWKRTLDTYSVASVEFSLSNPDVAYAGEVNAFFRSEDGGFTWRQMTPTTERWWGPAGVAIGTPIDIQVDPRNPDRLFVNAYGGGNFLSEDGGATWEAASTGYSGCMVRDIVLDPRGSGGIYAAGRSGLFVSLDGGNHWTGIAREEYRTLDWHAVAINPADPKIILSELTCDRVLVLSSDGGQHWQSIFSAANNFAFRSIEFAPSNPQIIYVGTAGYVSCGSFNINLPGQGIFVSHDGGRTWTEANDENMKDAVVMQIAIHPQDPQLVFAATANHSLMKSNDGGASWQPVYPALFEGKATSAVRFSPHEPSLIFAGCYQCGLLRSQDGGETWKISYSGLNPEATIVDIAFDPSNPKVIYVADLFSGVFRSLDGGMTWKAINNGLEMRAVNALALSGDGLHLYAGTEGRGVFRLDLNGMPPETLSVLATSTPASLPPQEATNLPTSVMQTAPAQPPTSTPSATAAPQVSTRCLSGSGAMLLMFLGVMGVGKWMKKRR